LKEIPNILYKTEAVNTYTAIAVQYPRTERRPSVERQNWKSAYRISTKFCTKWQNEVEDYYKSQTIDGGHEIWVWDKSQTKESDYWVEVVITLYFWPRSQRFHYQRCLCGTGIHRNWISKSCWISENKRFLIRNWFENIGQERQGSELGRWETCWDVRCKWVGALQWWQNILLYRTL